MGCIFSKSDTTLLESTSDIKNSIYYDIFDSNIDYINPIRSGNHNTNNIKHPHI
jgi:hypothetical protein